MELEAITSSLISHRGHDAATNRMRIRFKHKTLTNGALYEYGNVTARDYADGQTYVSERTGEPSFGAWFQRYIKAYPEHHPCIKIEDPHGEVQGLPFVDALVQSLDRATDFTSQQPIPATTVIEAEPLPADRDALVEKALQLVERARAIVITSPEAYSAAAVTGTAVAAMQVALKKAFYEGDDGITARHQRHKELMAIFNNYNDPLERDKERLRQGMIAYKRAEDAKAAKAAEDERQRLQRIADDEARQRAEDLKLEDAIEAEKRGEPELAQAIIESPALPLAPAYVPPQPIQSAAPKAKGAAHVPNWQWEYVDERGNPVATPRYDLIPAQYKMIDEKGISATVRTSKERTAIPGIRVYDAGNVRFSSKR